MSHYSHYQQIYWAASDGGSRIMLSSDNISSSNKIHQQNTDNFLLYF